MLEQLFNNPAVNRKTAFSEGAMPKQKQFYIESPTFLARREQRSGESEAQIRRDIEQNEPWRLPVTIIEVKP